MEAVGLLRVPRASPASVLHQLLAKQTLTEFNIRTTKKKIIDQWPSRIQERLRAFRSDLL